MNEKFEYDKMLEIPVMNTCNITVKKPQKNLWHRKKVNPETVKEELIKKVNEREEKNSEYDVATTAYSFENDDLKEKSVAVYDGGDSYPLAETNRTKISILGIGAFLVCALILVIALTNALVPNSGINIFLRSVFGDGEQATSVEDTRTFADFDVVIPYEAVNLDKGIITLNKGGSVYATANGVVESVAQDESGKYSVTIRHNDNFATVITGLNYSYFKSGSGVFQTIPIGYAKSAGATVRFLDKNSAVIANYTLNDNAVVWQV